MGNMTIRGVDTAARINAGAAKKLSEEGVRFAGRYLVPQTLGKALTAGEASDLHGAGLAILPVWEIDAERASKGAAQGAKDGETARKCAEALSIPENVTIYFAVDYNAPARDYDAIEYYLRNAGVACSPYGCGVYGKRELVEEMVRRIPTLYIWQCVAWSSGVSERADVYQYQWQGGAEAVDLKNKLGFAVDMNVCADLVHAGLWLPGAKRPWYADAMDWMKQEGLMMDGRPNDPVTRAELATVFYRKFGPEDDRPLGGLVSD